MIAFKLDNSGDLDFDQAAGIFNMIEGDDEIRQALWLLMGVNLGELSWNEDLGLNHMDVLINADDAAVVQSIVSDYLKDQLGEAFDSFQISDFKVDKQNRLTKLNGEVVLDGESYNERITLAQTIDNNDEGDDEDAS
ncbi:hypothetical protein [Levilactobacillus brevis]|uniref:hypothetical protein n=1 Tax=Levilactobacillus brevis TaxID=1580 RepID=UPI0008481960|nr:hypothetical protein [Levilactobacillus brevis]ODP95363.1 hypothetical protein BGC39_13795 [Levilactobacillus brevis]